MTGGCWRTASDIGSRAVNEDRTAVRHGVTNDPAGDHPLAVVCDGMGGHTSGEVASATAAEAFVAAYLETTARKPATAVAERLYGALFAADEAVREAVRADRALWGMGTTLTAAAVTSQGLEWVSVGDSPLYVVDADGGIEQVNERHNAPGRPNELTSAIMGAGIDEISASTRPRPLEPGERVVIATDGIDTLDEAAIGRIAAGGTNARTEAEDLVRRVLAASKARQDNVTVACLRAADAPGRYPRGRACGRRIGNEIEISVDARPLDWRRSLEVACHSPSGPEWGYRGSGPTQLALALLMEVADTEVALTHHGAFKDEHVASMDRDRWELELDTMREWVATAQAAVSEDDAVGPQRGTVTFGDPRVDGHGHMVVDVIVNGSGTGEVIARQDPTTDGDDRWYAHTAANLGDAAGQTWDTLEEALAGVREALQPRQPARAG